MELILDRSALERLIGGDTEVEISIRNGVIQDFAKKKIKAFYNDKLLQETIQGYCDQLAAEIKNQVGLVVSQRYGDAGGQLLDQIKTRIEEFVQKTLDTRIKKMIDEKVESYKQWIGSEINRRTRGFIDATIEKRIQEGIEERWKRFQQQQGPFYSKEPRNFIINGKSFKTDPKSGNPVISWVNIILWLYPDDDIMDRKHWTITYSNGPDFKPSGVLDLGSTVEIVENMIFNAADTSQA